MRIKVQRRKCKSRIPQLASRIPNPEDYRPRRPEDLIGPARGIARNLLAHAGRVSRLMLHGTWGNGKTSILNMLARKLVAGSTPFRLGIDCESVNGRNVTIDVVRDWQGSACYGSLFGGWKVKLINEADLMPLAAQELMLTFLDELPPRLAVLCSSNASLDSLSDRFATRFSPVLVGNPSDAAIARFLVGKFAVPKTVAGFIALSACGNVRDALQRASGYLIHGDLSQTGSVVDRPKREVVMIDPARSEASKRAWDTIRKGRNGKS